MGTIGTAILGLFSIAVVMGLFYYILGALTNTTISHGPGRKYTIRSNYNAKEEQDKYLKELSNKVSQIKAELKDKGIVMSDNEILNMILENKNKKR